MVVRTYVCFLIQQMYVLSRKFYAPKEIEHIKDSPWNQKNRYLWLREFPYELPYESVNGCDPFYWVKMRGWSTEDKF